MRKLLVEFIGTFFLVFVIALSGNPLAIGVVLMVMVYMGGPISGGHYNPAVSFGAWLSKKMPGGEMLLYRLTQLIAAFVAAWLAWRIMGVGLVPVPAGEVSWLQALVVEILFTFALVLVVLTTAASDWTSGNSYFGLAIGFTIMAAVYAGGPISGGAFNPAVGVSPLVLTALFGGAISQVWLYIAGPLLGGLLASWVYNYISVAQDKTS